MQVRILGMNTNTVEGGSVVTYICQLGLWSALRAKPSPKPGGKRWGESRWGDAVQVGLKNYVNKSRPKSQTKIRMTMQERVPFPNHSTIVYCSENGERGARGE